MEALKLAPVQEFPLSFRLISYNIQVGIGSNRLHHLVSHGWRYVMPHGQTVPNLERIADIVSGYDIVALNEVDAGSLRTRFVNQAEFLGNRAGYNYWNQMVTRDLGPFAQHTNAMLSRFRPRRIVRHRLPGPGEGRGLLEIHFDNAGSRLVLLLTHLSLSRRARLVQMRYIAEIANQYDNVVVTGDLNCTHHSPEMELLFRLTALQGARHVPATFPSWRPVRALDHILVSRNIQLTELAVVPEPLSDHLAVHAVVNWGRSPGQAAACPDIPG